MKSDMRSILFAACAVLLPHMGSAASENTGVEVFVAAISIPGDSSGMIHWHSTNVPTIPLQLSTRYFSEGVMPESNTLRFYAEPYDPSAAREGEPPSPLAIANIPNGSTRAYVVLWYSKQATGGLGWRATVFNANDWRSGSLKILNARKDTIGVMMGDKPIRIQGGKSADLSASDHTKPFPVKIYRQQPEKLIFSSTWRISAGRRELCFISGDGDDISLRSLIDLGAKKDR